MATNTWQIASRELRQALARLELASYIAWSDTRIRYRRSVLGPFWLVIGTAIGIGGLVAVWGTIFDVDHSVFIPSVTIGLVTWNLLSSTLMEASGVFYNNRSLILNQGASSILVSFQLMLRQGVNFVHNFIIVIVVLLLFPQHLSSVALLLIPGVVLVFLNLLWVIQLVGLIGARFRDLEPLLAAVIQPLFLLTPVLYRPEQLGSNSFIATFNPLTYLLALIREPLMGIVPSPTTWLVGIGMFIVGTALALDLTGRKRGRLAYWVH